MERLTEIVVDSFGKTRAVLIEPTKWSACANCNSRNNCDDCSLQKAVSKLSTIEDILGDDCDLDRLRVIVNQRMSMRDEVAKRFEITKNIPLDRLRELVEADRDGRCMVLPCKAGDKAYVIDAGDYHSDYQPYVREKEVTEISWKKARNGKDLGFGIILRGGDCNTSARCKISSIGKTVFLTREEAEAALEEMKNG